MFKKYELNSESKKIRRTDFLTRNQMKRWLYRRIKRCCYCLVKLNHDTATIDHIIPYKIVKRHHEDNLTLSCKACNQKKADKTPLEFIIEKSND